MTAYMCMFVHLVQEGVVPLFVSGSKKGTITGKNMKDAAERAFNACRINPRPQYIVIKTDAGTKAIFSRTSLDRIDEFSWAQEVQKGTASIQAPVQEEKVVEDTRPICDVCHKRYTGEVCRAPHYGRSQRDPNRQITITCGHKWDRNEDGSVTLNKCEAKVTGTPTELGANNNRCPDHRITVTA